MLKDQFGRTHDYLRISLTERCNLRCAYCMPPEGVPLTPKENLMTADEIFELARIHVGLGITKIRLTGGEPLVRKDVADIIEQLSTLDVKLTMTTNAVLIDKYLDLLWDNRMRSVNISLDTLDSNKFLAITKRDQFDRVWKNIESMLSKGFHVKLNCVAMKNFNEDEIIPFIELTREIPLHVRFIEFMPFDGNSWSWDRIISLEDILNEARS
ncbi:MAG: radical SAM protein, partial [Bacteroidetes bacterium]|nr:radical SAM protein [Bacteroidota bacterium]